MMTLLPLEYFLNDTIHGSKVTAYKSLIYDYLQVLSEDLGINLNQTQLHADIEALYLFERKIAEISAPRLVYGSAAIAGYKIKFDELEKQLDFVRS